MSYTVVIRDARLQIAAVDLCPHNAPTTGRFVYPAPIPADQGAKMAFRLNFPRRRPRRQLPLTWRINDARERLNVLRELGAHRYDIGHAEAELDQLLDQLPRNDWA